MDDRRDFAYAVWDDETDGRNNTQPCYDRLGHGGAVVRAVTEKSLCYAAALFDLKAKDKVEAVYGLSLTLGMVVTIGLSLTMMAMDMQRMLVQPVNDVLDILRGILMVCVWPVRRLPLRPALGCGGVGWGNEALTLALLEGPWQDPTALLTGDDDGGEGGGEGDGGGDGDGGGGETPSRRRDSNLGGGGSHRAASSLSVRGARPSASPSGDNNGVTWRDGSPRHVRWLRSHSALTNVVKGSKCPTTPYPGGLTLLVLLVCC